MSVSRPLTDDELIARLRAGIRNNQAIPAFFEAIKADPKAHQRRLLEIKLAIVQRDFENNPLNQPDDSLYLLYLIETKSVDFWQGITVYLYLMALMEFTPQQSLSPANTEARYWKSNQTVAMVGMMEEGELTDAGRDYVMTLIQRYQDTQGMRLHISPFIEFIKQLPRSEQTLLSITLPRHYQEARDQFGVNSVEAERIEFLDTLESNAPMFVIGRLKRHETTNRFLMPSMSIFQYLIKQATLEPVQLVPMFGRFASLEFLHAQHLHILPLYSPFVRDNYTAVHGRQCGLFACMVHDLIHTHMASLLTADERDTIYTCLLPLFRRLMQLEVYQSSLVELKAIIFQLNDMDLSPLQNYLNKDAFTHYVLKCICQEDLTKVPGFYANSTYSFIRPLGTLKHDFLLLSFLCECAKVSAENPRKRPLMKRLEAAALDSAREHQRSPRELAAIVALAANEGFEVGVVRALRYPEILLQLFTHESDSKILWEKLQAEGLYDDLLTLIIEGHLQFFHPIIPLTEENASRVIFALTNALAVIKKSDAIQIATNVMALFSSQDEAEIISLSKSPRLRQ